MTSPSINDTPNNDTPRSTERLKVLFMHGIESQPGCRKDRYLQQYFDVCTPDMKMSVFRLSKRNSVIRNVFRRPMFLIWATVATAALVAGWMNYGPLVLPLWGLVAVGTLLSIQRRLQQEALGAAFRRCIEIQEAAIRQFAPDVVVGASWGGAVALSCAVQNIYAGPMLLIAPAPKLVLQRTIGDADRRFGDLCSRLPKKTAPLIYVIHGDQDGTVPVEHSRELSEKTGVQLEIVPGGDHALNQHLILTDDDRLKHLVEAVAARRQSSVNCRKEQSE